MKKLVALMVAAVMLIALCATASAATTVTIWHTFTNAQDEALNTFAAEFNAMQDEYEVVLVNRARDNFESDTYLAVANGQGPNIIFNYASTAAEYVKDGLVVDLSKYIFDEEIGMQDVYESLKDSIKAEGTGFEDGGMYAIAAVTTGPVLFINKTLFDEYGIEIPTTWEEIGELSKVVYEKSGGRTAGFAVDSKADTLHALFMQSGSEYIDTEAKEVRFGTEANIKWLDWYAEHVQNGDFTHVAQSGYFSNDFNAGLVACYLGSCAGEDYIIPDGFEYITAPMPNTIDVSWYPAWNRGPIIFNKDEDSNRGAYLFVKYFLTPEVNTRWCEAMVAMSPYGTTTSSEAYADYATRMLGSLSAVEANLDYAGFLPTVTGSQIVRQEIQNALDNVAGGGMTGEEAMALCVELCNAALQE